MDERDRQDPAGLGEAGEAPTLAAPVDPDATLPHDGPPPPARATVALAEGPFAGGAFEIERQLGAGGMGVVYLALDTRLGRKVALKVHKVRAGEEGFDRLMREATAMARLQHPNVVSVHEVGTTGDQLFIVMDYMSGGTLGSWLRAESPSRERILDAFAAAGEGLAAAHEAGLVHRDFKPENVFMGAGDRVCVADFGLARAVGVADEDVAAEAPPSRGKSSGSLESKLTATGIAVGTPLFMAPEQFDGSDVDARADQFSFCVALYDALYGQHPFGGTSLAQLRERVTSGRIRDAPRDRNLPMWLRRLLLRGLSRDPDERFDDMRALLHALSRGRARRRRIVGASVGALALIVVAGGTFALSRGEAVPEPCTGAADRMTGVWDDDIRARVSDAFGSAPFGAKIHPRLASILDRYRASWISMRTQACQATKVEGDQTESLLDLRVACLERKRGELGALTSVLVNEPSPDVIATSVEAAYKLSRLDACADSEALLAAYPPPKREHREIVETLRERLDQVDALSKTGQYKSALVQALAVEEATRNVAYPPLRAEALLLLGRLHHKVANAKQAEDTLRAAASAAADARDDVRLALAWIELVRVIGYLSARHDEALALADWLTTTVRRAGDGAELRSELAFRRGLVLEAKASAPQALESYNQALRELIRARGESHPSLATIHHNIGDVYRRMGELSEAKRHAERARELAEAGYGPRHPEVSNAYNVLAILHDIDGDTATAKGYFERALALRRETLGDAHPRVASSMNGLGITQRKLGMLDAAERTFSEAYDIWRRALGREHPNTTSPLNNLARTFADQGRWTLSLDTYAKSLAILEKALGTRHPRLQYPLQGMALAERALGRVGVARRHCARARGILEATYGLEKLDDHLEEPCRSNE